MLSFYHHLIVSRLLILNEMQSCVDQINYLKDLMNFHRQDKMKNKYLQDTENDYCIQYYDDCLLNILGVDELG
jgi:hypothetical protein